jgi:glycosyltransferase involved in cell wall biosynthesis
LLRNEDNVGLNIGIFAGPDTGFGDTIRTKKIIEFLYAKGYKVVNLNLGGASPVNKISRRSALLPEFTKSFFARSLLLDHINLLRLSKNLEKKVQKEKIDILQCETTIPAYIGSLVLKRRKIPLIFDMHGLSSEQAIMEGKPAPLVNYIRKIQIMSLKSANHIFAVSSLHKEHLQSIVAPEKITVVPNAGEVRPYVSKSDEEINVVYGGIFSYWENISSYVKCTTLDRDRKVNYYLLGDGPIKENLMDMIVHLSAPIKYLGKLPRNEALRFFDRCHIGVLTSSKDIARQIACPIKFFDYMSCGLVVVSEEVGWWPKLIRGRNVGLVVKQNSPPDLYEGICSLAKNDEKRKSMSQNAYELIGEEFNWNKQLSKMEKIYHSL